ncbi:aldehyde dehydrogenase EutE [Sporanaerobium hydrogeniformans]|uniref:Aldehyde dehydrogenase EutE n=1 Tax=Sporanaerobium hydrogeniformans TaxID=3072179 RepID=A0AC61D9Q7_9FIRM|nr:aldehyde dehydrogenase family protein [Sporanaerobium hydrogeniformans]PHV69418.1 aldehyde dehydrogenase EutE [Sporanaerobium hydrogeniformans]
MDISTQEIERIVKSVVAGLSKETSANEFSTITSYTATESPPKRNIKGEWGVFEDVELAIEAAYKAQIDWVTHYKIYERQRVIENIRRIARQNIETWCHLIIEETQMGRYEDKLEKHLAVINSTPGPECLITEAMTGDSGLMLEEYAPFGVIAAITPTTNPTETIINNTISMIAGGNAVVFNVHPRAKKVCTLCLQTLNKAILEAGGPENLITMTREPSLENVDKLAASPQIRLMVGTGGMGMVNKLLHSGKKTIGAGAGNPPVIVDETADIELAASQIYKGASFDNNILCFAEKEVFVVSSHLQGFIYNMKKQGAYLIENHQIHTLLEKVFVLKTDGNYDVNKDWVGKDATCILESIGIYAPKECRLIICEVPANHPFVMVEQLMPILPIVRCENFEEAMQKAVLAEQGNRHTASIFSKDVNHMTQFARAIETTIYVKNSATMAGVGIGGEGHTTMTIAGPTGEGITCARSFTRRRRCMLAEGGLRIV